jgi:hypothetical protein
MLPFLAIGLSLLQKKQQQNAADQQRITNSLEMPQTQQPQANLGANSLLATQPQQTNVFETEEEKRKRLLGL